MTDIPDRALRARQLYLDGEKVDDIQRKTGLSCSALYLWLAGGPETDGLRPLPPIPLRRVNVFSGKHRNARAGLIVRMMNAAERQVRDIEARPVAAPEELDGRERNARVLGMLVKTLRELAQVDTRTPRQRKPKDEDDDAIPRNLDELRQELTRRLEAMADRVPERIHPEGGGERT